MVEKQLVHVFIKASVSELKIHSALVAGRYRKRDRWVYPEALDILDLLFHVQSLIFL